MRTHEYRLDTKIKFFFKDLGGQKNQKRTFPNIKIYFNEPDAFEFLVIRILKLRCFILNVKKFSLCVSAKIRYTASDNKIDIGKMDETQFVKGYKAVPSGKNFETII